MAGKGRVYLITQDFQHGFKTLLFRPEFCRDLFSLFIDVYQNMFGRWNQAVLDPAITANRFLISASVEHADVLHFGLVELWQINRVAVFFGVVEIFTVASQPAKKHALIFHVPIVDGQQDKFLVDRPGIWEGVHE